MLWAFPSTIIYWLGSLFVAQQKVSYRPYISASDANSEVTGVLSALANAPILFLITNLTPALSSCIEPSKFTLTIF